MEKKVETNSSSGYQVDMWSKSASIKFLLNFFGKNSRVLHENIVFKF